MENNYKHISVLLDESIEALQIKCDGVYVDCTLGGGGHSSEILKRLKNGHLYAFDQDEYAIEVANKRLSAISNNYTLIQDNFCNIKNALLDKGITKVDGIIYDLGVSSFQLDIPERGFSYRFDGPLDMRMDQNSTLDAYHVVNFYSEAELKRILFEYGEEKFAPRIARSIINARSIKPIDTTFELVDVIKHALPAAVLRGKGHPAKQTFQAIRIEVNKELDILKNSIEDGLDLLNSGGIMVVITFHSLEDKIVKRVFKDRTSLNLPKDLPYIPEGYSIDYELINKKIVLPSEKEIETNNRSHSAKMRIILKK